MKYILIAIMAMGAVACGQMKKNSGTKSGTEQQYYIDIHRIGPGKVTAEDVAMAHEKDLEVQDVFGVNFIQYWVDEQEGNVYCLSSAENKSAIINTHAEAHGLIPEEVILVEPGMASEIVGKKQFFLDIHELGAGNVTAAAVAEAHEKDLAVQGEYHVNFVNYWVDEASGRVMCLSEAPDSAAVIHTHEKAHGLLPDRIVPVVRGE